MKARRLAAFALAFAFAVTGGGLGLNAQTPAEVALAAGDLGTAKALAHKALEVAPDDPVAHAVLAAVHLATGAPEAARREARKSWRAAKNPELSFVAAHLAARAARESGAPMAAQLWLRRAVQVAPDPISRLGTINEIKKIRQNQLLSFTLDLAVSPTDNVNNGARDRVLSIDGIPTFFTFGGSALALSGVEGSVSLALRYRLSGTQGTGTELSFRLRQSAVALSSAAQRLAPTARGADYARTSVDLGLVHTRQLQDHRAMRLGVTLSQNWLGGVMWSQQARAEGALAFRLGAATQSRIAIGADRQWRAGNLAFATALSVDGIVERKLASGDVLGLQLMAGQTWSQDRNRENTRLSANLLYAREAPVAGGRLTASLGAAAVDYPVFFGGVFSDSGREDKTLSASIEMAFPEMGAYGFEPVIALQGSKTRSNISRYQTKSLGLEVRIRSSF